MERTSPLMPLLNLASLELWALAGISKQDFSWIVQHWPLPYEVAIFAFSNTTSSKHNLETMSHLVPRWQLVKGNWVLQDQFSTCTILFFTGLGWREVSKAWGRFVWATFHSLAWFFPRSQPDHHLPCSKGQVFSHLTPNDVDIYICSATLTSHQS